VRLLGARSRSRNSRDDFDETETLIILPCCIYLLLAIRLRKLLRRRIGRRAGTVAGNVVIVVLGGPPLLMACATVLLIRLVLKLLSVLDKAA
jgi:hypothetical protein